MRCSFLLRPFLVVFDIKYGFKHKLHLQKLPCMIILNWSQKLQNQKRSSWKAYSFSIYICLAFNRGGLQLIHSVLYTLDEVLHCSGIITPYFHPTAYTASNGMLNMINWATYPTKLVHRSGDVILFLTPRRINQCSAKTAARLHRENDNWCKQGKEYDAGILKWLTCSSLSKSGSFMEWELKS